MSPEESIIENVEMCIEHPPYQGSQETMLQISKELDDHLEAEKITHETHNRLQTLIMNSHHFRAA